MRAATVVAALLLTACSGGGSSAPNTSRGEDAAVNTAAVSIDANSPDMNAAEIVPDDEGGNEVDSGA
jgi:hypothetical protein